MVKKINYSPPLGNNHSSHIGLLFYGIFFMYTCVYISTFKGKWISYYTFTMYRFHSKVPGTLGFHTKLKV